MSGAFWGWALPMALAGAPAALLLLALARGRALPAWVWGAALALRLAPAALPGGAVRGAVVGQALTQTAGPSGQALTGAAFRLAESPALGKWAFLAGWLWLAGALALAAWKGAGWLGFQARLRRCRRPAEEELCRAWAEILGRPGRVWGLEGEGQPFVAGLFRPALYLPRNGEREKRQDWMLRHEAAHLRRGHLWLKALGGVVGVLYWFDPLVPALRRRLEEACELESDRAVCGGMGPEERREYAGLLLAFAEKAPGPGGSGFSRRGRQLETRILALRRGGAAFGRRGLSVLALALVLACLPVQAFCRQELGGLEEGSRLLQGALSRPENFLPGPEEKAGDLAEPEKLLRLEWPVEGYRYCSRSQVSGLSIVAEPGTLITAAADGVVLAAGETQDQGLTLVLVHGLEPDISTSYGHCSELLVTPGQWVRAGQPIARVGQTGLATGPFCRYQVRIEGQLYPPALWHPDKLPQLENGG